jgi:periplasmic protein CpxP/Spy
MKLNRTLGLLIVATATVGAGAAVAAATTAATTTTATTTATTPAPGGMHWHHRHGGMLVGGLLRATRQLNLTEQQQTQIKGILSTARSQHQAAAAAGTNAVDMTVLANPGDPNYATALQTAKSRFEARMQSQAELQSQIYNVLTADQKAKLPTVLATMKAQAEQRRAAWQAQHPAAGSN